MLAGNGHQRIGKEIAGDTLRGWSVGWENSAETISP